MTKTAGQFSYQIHSECKGNRGTGMNAKGQAAQRRDSFAKFLNAPSNTKTRERIFFHLLHYDLSIAAARASYPLTIFQPEVDRDGYDIVIDDREFVRQIQLKTATKSAGTATWTVPRRFLLPTRQVRDEFRFGFETSPSGEGSGGGVILTMIDDEVAPHSVEYYYTDVAVIAALESGLVRLKGTDSKRRQQAKKAMTELRGRNKKVALPLGVFVKLQSSEALLSIAGFRSKDDLRFWGDQLSLAMGKGFEVDSDGNMSSRAKNDARAFAQEAAMSLRKLVCDDGLVFFDARIATK